MSTEQDTQDDPRESGLDPDRRKEISKDALDTGREDPYWLHNLSVCSRFNSEAYGDMLDHVEQLREDANLIEEAHERIESGELLPAEAALLIAEKANFGGYDTKDHLYDGFPIGLEE